MSRRCRACLTVAPPRVRKCPACSKALPKRRRPTHMKALELDYAAYVEINGGDHCGVCGKTRTDSDRRFDRDHDHKSGKPRGLLCHIDNRLLASWVTPERLEAAATYLRRAA